MKTQALALNRDGWSRGLMVIAATSALALSMFAIAAPVRAATVVHIESNFIGTSSATFSEQEDDCGPFGTTGSGVVWHFILNQLDTDTPAGTLTAQFATAADQTATGGLTGGDRTQHFYVLTPADDVLDDAWASVTDQSSDSAKLVLSHVCHQSGGSSQEPTPTPTQSVAPSNTPGQSSSPTETPEGSVLPGTGTPAPSNSPEGGVKGATGTPAPTPPDTSVLGTNTTVPTVLFVLVLLASLGGLAYLNIGSARQRD